MKGSARARAKVSRGDEILKLLQPEDDWEELHRPLGSPQSRPPGQGAFVPSEPDGRLCLRCYRRPSDGKLVGKAWFGPGAEGPPGHAHGGSQVAVMDHALGAAAWSAGYPCFTASLTHDFRRPLPLGRLILVEAWVESVEGRKVHIRGQLSCAASGELYGESSGLFVRMSEERLAAFRERLARVPSHT